MSIKVEIRREKINLRAGLEHLTIIHISDLHLPFSAKRIDEIKHLVFNSSADIIAMTGDYVDSRSSIPKFINLVESIAVKAPVVYILGNHDKRFSSSIKEGLSQIQNCSCLDETPFQFISKKGFRYVFTSWLNRKLAVAEPNVHHFVLVHKP